MKFNSRFAISCYAFLISVIGQTWANYVIYVDPNASGTGDGSSWQSAYNYLQDALADANTAAKPIEICVAQGIYKPNEYAGGTGDQTSFVLIDGVAIKGGYAGTSLFDPNERDISAYQTVLSGDINGDDSDDEQTKWDNSYHVVAAEGNTSSAVLDGFTVTAGYAFVGSNVGAGLYMKNASPTISNCTFQYNQVQYYGGAVYCDHSEPNFITCLFEENKAQAAGGAIYCRYSILNLEACIFLNNRLVGAGEQWGRYSERCWHIGSHKL